MGAFQKIEITPAMLEAGAGALIDLIGDDVSYSDRARLVWEAMAEAAEDCAASEASETPSQP